MAKYSIEIWDKSGNPIADIRQFCSGLQWSKTLNGSESISFTVDLFRFEQLLDKIGYSGDPYGFFEVGRCDIRIKRNGTYIVGANAYSFTYTTSDPTVTMNVQCVGYLNFYKTQYVTASFSQQNQEDILWSVIAQCNAKTGGDYGVTRGTHTGATVVRDRNYSNKEVASLIQQMSDVIGGPDFEFTPDKKFNTFEVKGTYRPSVKLEYPGNIQSFSFSRSMENVANYIYGIGSGNGDDAIQTTAEDATSEGYLYRREKIITWNSVTLQDTLDEHTNAALHYYKDIIEIPTVTVRDGAIDLSEVDTGDTVVLDLSSNLSLQHINGDYRIEQIECRVDENDSEETTLTFDNLDIDDIIQEQEEE